METPKNLALKIGVHKMFITPFFAQLEKKKVVRFDVITDYSIDHDREEAHSSYYVYNPDEIDLIISKLQECKEYLQGNYGMVRFSDGMFGDKA